MFFCPLSPFYSTFSSWHQHGRLPRCRSETDIIKANLIQKCDIEMITFSLFMYISYTDVDKASTAEVSALNICL